MHVIGVLGLGAQVVDVARILAIKEHHAQGGRVGGQGRIEHAVQRQLAATVLDAGVFALHAGFKAVHARLVEQVAHGATQGARSEQHALWAAQDFDAVEVPGQRVQHHTLALGRSQRHVFEVLAGGALLGATALVGGAGTDAADGDGVAGHVALVELHAGRELERVLLVARTAALKVTAVEHRDRAGHFALLLDALVGRDDDLLRAVLLRLARRPLLGRSRQRGQQAGSGQRGHQTGGAERETVQDRHGMCPRWAGGSKRCPTIDSGAANRVCPCTENLGDRHGLLPARISIAGEP